MNGRNLELRAERSVIQNRIELFVLRRLDNGITALARPPLMENIELGAYITQPTLSLKLDEAQLLIDELWRCGIRPTEGHGSAGQLGATERHLKDMQKITMGLLRKHGVENE